MGVRGGPRWSSPDRAVRVRALARDTVLSSWARHLTLTVPLSTQVYKWVPANLMLGVASCYGKRDKLWPDGPLGSYADSTFMNRSAMHSRPANARALVVQWLERPI